MLSFEAQDDRKSIFRTLAKAKFSPVRPNDIARDGKAQAGTGGALSMEWLPDSLPFGRRDSWPVIDKFDDGGIILGEDANLQTCLCPVLQGIVDQVRQGLTQTNAISSHEDRFRRIIEGEVDVTVERQRNRIDQGLACKGGEVDGLELCDLGPMDDHRVAQKLVRQAAEFGGSLPDPAELVLASPRLGFLREKINLRRQSGQRGPDLMGCIGNEPLH